MDHVAFCKNFFAATNIPVNLIQDGYVAYSSMADLLGITDDARYTFYQPAHNPSFQAYSPDIVYGMVEIEGTDYRLIVGPAFSVPVTEPVIRQYMRETGVAPDRFEQIAELFLSFPRVSSHQFLNYLALLHQCLNGKEADLHDFFTENETFAHHRIQQQMDQMVNGLEAGDLHNTYKFEQELYHYIREGSVPRLRAFLDSQQILLAEGRMAHTPVRHARNLFIATLVKVGMLGAIPGGVDVERTYQLIDFYAQECETLQTIEEIENLRYIMLMDLCRRAGEAHIPAGVSAEVRTCMSYIRNHVNAPVSVEEVIAQTGRSASMVAARFKKELGMRIGDYITACKLEEAKGLLTYSDKSLAEISNYLCFSSQAYFQNQFKKHCGVTPLQYRRQTKTV